MLWNAFFLRRYRHLSALHISNTRECYDWVTLWWDTWEFKLGQKPAFREVINCELFTCFDKCSPQVQTWPKRRTSLATLYHDQNAGSPWLRPLLPPPPASRPGLPFWIVKTWPKLTSLHFFVWKKRLHRVLTRILEHIWMYNRFCLEYICAEVASAFHDFFLLVFLLVLICPVLVVALLILLGHRTVNRDPCILYSRVGARRI